MILIFTGEPHTVEYMIMDFVKSNNIKSDNTIFKEIIEEINDSDKKEIRQNSIFHNKLFIVSDPNKKTLQYLETIANSANEDKNLIIIIKKYGSDGSVSKSGIGKLCIENNLYYNYPEIKDQYGKVNNQSRAIIVNIFEDMLKRNSLQVDKNLICEIAMLCDYNLIKISNVTKQLLFMNNSGVEIGGIKDIIPNRSESNIFEFIDSLQKRDIKECLGKLNSFIFKRELDMGVFFDIMLARFKFFFMVCYFRDTYGTDESNEILRIISAEYEKVKNELIGTDMEYKLPHVYTIKLAIMACSGISVDRMQKLFHDLYSIFYSNREKNLDDKFLYIKTSKIIVDFCNS